MVVDAYATINSALLSQYDKKVKLPRLDRHVDEVARALLLRYFFAPTDGVAYLMGRVRARNAARAIVVGWCVDFVLEFARFYPHPS